MSLVRIIGVSWLLALTIILLPGSTVSATPGPISLVAVDADNTNGPPAGGNVSNDIGPVDRCRSIANGNSVTVDVVVDSVPAFDDGTFSGGLLGIGMDLLYDKRVLNVTGWTIGINSTLYYSSPISNPVDVDDPLPDTDGRYRIDSGDTTVTVDPEEGEGILARVTFQAVQSGASIIEVTDLMGESDAAKGTPRLYSADRTPYEITTVQHGMIAVAQACPATLEDFDADGVINEADNCPLTKNGAAQASLPATGNQTDTDLDGDGDACEDRDRDSEPPVTHGCSGACPGGAFRDAAETLLGTNPALRCAATSTANDEAGADNWPLDFNDDQRATTVDVGGYVSRLNTSAPGPPYQVRYDLNMSGTINSIDVGFFVAVLGNSCANIPDEYDACPASFADPVDAIGCSAKQVDWDGDGRCDPWAPSAGPGNCTGTDNCWRIVNAAQPDADADGKGNACDPEGPGPNTDGLGGANDCTDGVDNDGDGLTDAAEPLCSQTGVDADNDFFSDGLEIFLGSVTNDACAATSTANDEALPDAWPPDFDDNQAAAHQDAVSYISYLGTSAFQTYEARRDLEPDGVVGMRDILNVGYHRSVHPNCSGF